LHGANFLLAELKGADLTGARVRFAVFAENDLSETKGLNALVTGGPPQLALSTLRRSRGEISHDFLRLCGVPNTLVGPLLSSFGELPPDQYYSCFISYSYGNEDTAFAEHLCSRITQPAR
jgi:hypothetical protein